MPAPTIAFRDDIAFPLCILDGGYVFHFRSPTPPRGKANGSRRGIGDDKCEARMEERNEDYILKDWEMRDLALTGCTISIPLLGGENTTLTVEDIIYPGYRTTIPDQGMPIAKGEGKGNLKVMFLVESPTSLTQEQRSDVLTILEDS